MVGRLAGLTVLTLKTPMTLSKAVPLFGSNPNSLFRPLASWSTRSFISSAEYDFPERPQVKGSCEDSKAWRPYFGLSINSSSEIESGGSMAILGTHDGG